MRYFLSLLFLSSFIFALDSNFELEETNIFTKTESIKPDDYNRLRLYSTFENQKFENYLFQIILDNYNNYNGEKSTNVNDTQIYRGYLKYSDEKQLLTIGKQRVPYGVGRVWNPTDIYNPIDATAIESDERKGVEALRYEYTINNLSNIDTTVSKDKYAIRIKGYLGFADFGLITIKDEKKDQTILGYEIQGELFNTGLELRSEGGYFNNKNRKDYKEFIIGAEYGFENSLNILSEYKYNSLQNQDYLALNLSYTLSTLVECSYLGIKNLDDRSTVSLARVSYSLSDESELEFGTYKYTGKIFSEYGSKNDTVFLRFFVHF